jgi:hypothetical protein
MSLRAWARVRLPDFAPVRARITRLRITWLRLAIAAATFAGLAVGLTISIRTTGWEQTFANIDLNIVATVVVAFGAIFTFQLAIRFHVLRQILANQPLTPPVIQRPTGRRPNQARAVVAQLQDDRHLGRIFLEARSSDARLSFVRELIPVLATSGIVALVVHLDPGEVNVVTRAGQEFQSLVRRAGVSDVPLARTLEWLATHRRMVVIVENIDAADSIGGQDREELIVRQRVASLVAAGYPFVAITDATPSSSSDGYDRVVIAPIDYVDITLNPAPTTSDDESVRARRSRAVRSLAVNLQRTGLERSTVVSENSDAPAMELVSSTLANSGAVHYGCARLVNATRGIAQSLGIRTPESDVVIGLVVRLLATGGEQMDVMELYRDLRSTEAHSILLAIRHLEDQRILTRTDVSDKTLLGFADPVIAELAAGAWLAHQPDPYAVSLQRSNVCLSAEVYQRVAAAGQEAPAQWSAAIKVFKQKSNTLAAASAAYSAIVASTTSDASLGVDWLPEIWAQSGAAERLSFSKQISGNVVSSFAPFLWSRVTGKEFGANPHTLRRSICRALGASSAGGWEALGATWSALIDDPSLAESLAWQRRPISGPWKGSTIASLCWILPSIVATYANPGPIGLLHQLTALVTPGAQSTSDDRPDVGIEISLAEGCKDACYTCFIDGLTLPSGILRSARILIRSGRSWVTRLIGLQSLFIAATIDANLIDEVSAECRLVREKVDEHPILRSYASVLWEPIQMMRGGDASVGDYIWNDDTEALSEAGGELCDDAVIILAVIAILLNFSEGRAAAGDSIDEAHGPRVRALTENILPQCFQTRRDAAASSEMRCGCGFGICGPDIRLSTVRRPLSRTFVYRCLAARPTPALGNAMFATTLQGVREHLRRLTI